MATAITAASFRTACSECADAIIAEDWTTAWKKYAVAEAINSGLETSAARSGMSLGRRDKLAGLKEALTIAEAKVKRGTDMNRMGTGQTRHAR